MIDWHRALWSTATRMKLILKIKKINKKFVKRKQEWYEGQIKSKSSLTFTFHYNVTLISLNYPEISTYLKILRLYVPFVISFLYGAYGLTKTMILSLFGINLFGLFWLCPWCWRSRTPCWIKPLFAILSLRHWGLLIPSLIFSHFICFFRRFRYLYDTIPCHLYKCAIS